MIKVILGVLIAALLLTGSIAAPLDNLSDDDATEEINLGPHETLKEQPDRNIDDSPSTDQAADAPFGVRFVCPEGTVSDESSQAMQYDHFCPLYLYDPADIMGQPVLTVDPNRPDYMAINSLHGGRGLPNPTQEPPPTERSRDNDVHQPHTTWRTDDEGVQWTDDRYYAPTSLASEERKVYGESNAAAMDSNGEIYLSTLYSYRENESEGHDYAVVFWNGDRASRAMDYHSDYLIHYVEEGHQVERISSVFLRDSNRILTTWKQTSPEGDSWIQGFWTQPGRGANWQPLPEESRIGPCDNITNPIYSLGKAYIGCAPGDGYVPSVDTVKENFTMDSYQIHAINVENWTSEHVSSSPVSDGFGLLVRMNDRWGHDGNMAVVSSGIDGEGEPFAEVTHGLLGEDWGGLVTFGDKLRETGEASSDVTDARVTAAAYLAESGNFHMIYAEQYETNTLPEGGPLGGAGDFTEYEYHKTYAVGRIVGDGRFSGNFDLQYGNQDMMTSHTGSMNPERRGLSEGIFWDLHDSIIVWRDPDTGKERTFTAFGDHGFVRFAEVVEDNPPVAIPLPAAPVPPVPLAAAGTNPATIGAVAGILFGLMLTMMTAARKKKPMEVPH